MAPGGGSPAGGPDCAQPAVAASSITSTLDQLKRNFLTSIASAPLLLGIFALGRRVRALRRDVNDLEPRSVYGHRGRWRRLGSRGLGASDGADLQSRHSVLQPVSSVLNASHFVTQLRETFLGRIALRAARGKAARESHSGKR